MSRTIDPLRSLRLHRDRSAAGSLRPWRQRRRLHLQRRALAVALTLALCTLPGTAPPAAGAPASVKPPACTQVAGNLVEDCGFTAGISGWREQAASTVGWERRLGHRAPGALRMVNEPASEAGAVLCVPLAGGAEHELAGFARRLQGTGSCLALLQEHDTPDCSGGTTRFHELTATPLAPGGFTRVSGRATLGSDTESVTAGFACYGEQDDDVSAVLIDDVSLVRLPSSASDARP